MLYNHKRLKNRILQAMYRPKVSRSRLLSGDALSFIDELDRRIEEKITPLLSELF